MGCLPPILGYLADPAGKPVPTLRNTTPGNLKLSDGSTVIQVRAFRMNAPRYPDRKPAISKAITNCRGSNHKVWMRAFRHGRSAEVLHFYKWTSESAMGNGASPFS